MPNPPFADGKIYRAGEGADTHQDGDTSLHRFHPDCFVDEKTPGDEEGASGEKLNFWNFASQQTGSIVLPLHRKVARAQ
jgi:hypothetical protein